MKTISNNERKKCILFINLYTEMGGGEYAMYYLVKEIDKTKFHPIMLFNHRGTFVDKVEAIGVESALVPFQTIMLKMLIRPSVLWSTMKASRLMREYMKEHRIDIIHCSDVLALILVAVPAMRLRIPIIYNVIFFYERMRMIVFNMLAIFLVKRIITNSLSVKQDLAQKTFFLSKKIETVYHGIDTTIFRPLRSGEQNPLRTELGVEPRVKLVGMVGRVDPSKGQMIFLRAAKRILEQRRDIRFVLVGGLLNDDAIPSLRTYYNEVMELANPLINDGSVIILPHRNDTPELMRSFDVVVCPSVSEGFGLVVLEALASGVPLVASRTVGALEVVRNERGVYIAEVADTQLFADRICEALEASSSKAHPADQYRSDRMATFTWPAYAQHFEKVYTEVHRENH